MKELTATVRLTALTLCVCSIGYATAMLGFAQAVTPWSADGSLLRDDSGTVIGSAQVAQAFSEPQYFWPRPSAVNYDASATGGSNLSPANPGLTERAQRIIEQYGGQDRPIPADLVSASGSGIDPHITLKAALFQVQRVAKSRRIPEEQVRNLISEMAESAVPIIPGSDTIVNVLKLNVALDTPSRSTKP